MEPCWICLQEDGQLVQPCNCPRFVHQDCLATWCLQSAGTAEEHTCRFCSQPLPDWKEVLGGNHHAGLLPVVAVVFEGCEWRLRVPPTAEGARRFQRQIELITGLPFDEQVGKGRDGTHDKERDAPPEACRLRPAACWLMHSAVIRPCTLHLCQNTCKCSVHPCSANCLLSGVCRCTSSSAARAP